MREAVDAGAMLGLPSIFPARGHDGPHVPAVGLNVALLACRGVGEARPPVVPEELVRDADGTDPQELQRDPGGVVAAATGDADLQGLCLGRRRRAGRRHRALRRRGHFNARTLLGHNVVQNDSGGGPDEATFGRRGPGGGAFLVGAAPAHGRRRRPRQPCTCGGFRQRPAAHHRRRRRSGRHGRRGGTPSAAIGTAVTRIAAHGS
mmetsp:Transcript_111416/g.314590  ORF Transcript_111416/g.314590 Transcript_111416/m.314590 type:complete len:205 (+) Transcript_111416:1012-1626(+)